MDLHPSIPEVALPSPQRCPIDPEGSSIGTPNPHKGLNTCQHNSTGNPHGISPTTKELILPAPGLNDTLRQTTDNSAYKFVGIPMHTNSSIGKTTSFEEQYNRGIQDPTYWTKYN